MSKKDSKQEKNEPSLPEIPSIPQTPSVPEIPVSTEIETQTEEKVVEEEDKKEDKPQIQIQETIKTVTDQVVRLIDIEPFKREMAEKIKKKLKQGETLLIGEKIGSFAEDLAKENGRILAFDTSATFVTPKAEVKDKKILEVLELKPFNMDKFMNLSGIYMNIILFFALKKMKDEERIKLLKKAKDLISRHGQIIVVDEFYPRSLILYIITSIKLLLNTIKAKLTNTAYYYPLRKLDKIAKKLELKFFETKYDAQGRIRTYVFTKRWGALL